MAIVLDTSIQCIMLFFPVSVVIGYVSYFSVLSPCLPSFWPRSTYPKYIKFLLLLEQISTNLVFLKNIHLLSQSAVAYRPTVGLTSQMLRCQVLAGLHSILEVGGWGTPFPLSSVGGVYLIVLLGLTTGFLTINQP